MAQHPCLTPFTAQGDVCSPQGPLCAWGVDHGCKATSLVWMKPAPSPCSSHWDACCLPHGAAYHVLLSSALLLCPAGSCALALGSTPSSWLQNRIKLGCMVSPLYFTWAGWKGETGQPLWRDTGQLLSAVSTGRPASPLRCCLPDPRLDFQT